MKANDGWQTMTAEDFQIGKAYFSCGYYVRSRPIPMIDTAIFLGKNIYGVSEGGDHHYFQDPASYLREEQNFDLMEEGMEGVSDEDGDGVFFVPSANVTGFMTDLAGLANFVRRLVGEPGAREAFGESTDLPENGLS
jgi:hypothetical protein